MRIAIVGAGLTGLSAAHILSEDPRQVTTVFETRARFGGRVDEQLVTERLGRLSRLGVTLRRNAQVERLAVDDTGADLWINGLPESFDVALVATSPAEARALLARSGIGRRGTTPLRKRVYFAEDAPAAALARMAADHSALRTCSRTTYEAPPRAAHVLKALARRVATHVEWVDLSGETWPLETPAIYVANRRWALDAMVPQHLARRPTSAEATVSELEAGASPACVVGDWPAVRAVAEAALALNAPLLPIAGCDRPAPRRVRKHVAIGRRFYPETSSIDELIDDIRMVVRHLEDLAVGHEALPTALANVTAA